MKNVTMKNTKIELIRIALRLAIEIGATRLANDIDRCAASVGLLNVAAWMSDGEKDRESAVEELEDIEVRKAEWLKVIRHMHNEIECNRRDESP